ncbi:MAG TPA: hypothetical protein VNZ57_14340 [Longimicrobiales bacterium]|nr:hypothetical protein [Longimicrobiales bacterium]
MGFEPQQFLGTPFECGTIVIWTRAEPPPRPFVGFLWKPALAGFVFFLIANWISDLWAAEF